jgi:predicted negative regulator of RcsB-dependent stress response
MVKGIFKTKKIAVVFFIIIFIAVQSCSNDETNKTQNNKPGDSITYDNGVKRSPNDNGSLNGFTKPVDEAAKERQEMILMQIDSTYAAITSLDEAKQEMTELSPDGLTMAERNKKSKAIFTINIIQNELTRALDASILANLRVRTEQLQGISKELEKNISHLQAVSQKLNKATQCIGRLTNIFATCLSKGWIKPPTPKDKSPENIKGGLN